MTKVEDFCEKYGIGIQSMRDPQVEFRNGTIDTYTRRWICVLTFGPIDRVVRMNGAKSGGSIRETLYTRTLQTKYGAGVGVVLTDIKRPEDMEIHAKEVWMRETPSASEVLHCLLSDDACFENHPTAEQYCDEYGCTQAEAKEISKKLRKNRERLLKFLPGELYHEASNAFSIDEDGE